MNVNVYRITNDNGLERVLPDQAAKGLSDTASCLWIDVEQPSNNDLQDLLGYLDLHPLVLKSCMEPAASPPLAPFRQCMFIRIPFLQNGGHEDVGFLCIIVLSNTIVTVHESPTPALETLANDFSAAMRFHTTGTPSILYHVIDRLIDEDMAFALDSRRQIEALAEKAEKEFSSSVIDDLHMLNRIVTQIEDTLEDQLFSVTSLQAAEMEFLDIKAMRLHFRDSLAHLEYALTSVARQQAHVAGLHQRHQLNLQNRTNRRLRILTVLSAIFMPLTLFAGIYGMNFKHMPELHWLYGYPAVLIFMLIIAGLLLGIFSRKGWFD